MKGNSYSRRFLSTSAVVLLEPPHAPRSSLQQVRGIPPSGLPPTLEPGDPGALGAQS